MLASLKWLKELSGIDLQAEDAERRLTAAGIEVEAVHRRGRGLEKAVVAEVRAVRNHPSRDDLTLVDVFDGAARYQVVCGAPNVPAAGGRVVFAGPGAVLPGGMEIAPRKMGGELSQGMLCSEAELDIGCDQEGILVLEPAGAAKCGTPVAEALDLEDTVLEISVTPNRPDCLGHVGLARELCALYQKPFAVKPPDAPARVASLPHALYPQGQQVFSLTGLCGPGAVGAVQEAGSGPAPLRLDIQDPDRCPRYGAALVTGVTIATSPFWVRYRLHILGVRAINNAVDATNLILLGFSHPIHGFDYDKVRGSRIVVRLAAPDELVRTLDGQDRLLTADDLLICDGDGPVALAGVMGGESSEISPRTRRVLIECAFFDPRSIRRTARRTGLRSEASYRFERGVDPSGVRMVLAHAACLVAQLAGGAVVSEAFDLEPLPAAPRRISLRSVRIDALLGTEVDPAEARGILQRLGCGVTGSGQIWEVSAPTFRPDLKGEQDLIEEIARVRGYHRIPTEAPKIRSSAEGTPRLVGFVRRLREAAAAAGLNEAVNYAFVSARDLAAARAPAEAVALANPLSEERAVLRTSLLPGLAANLQRAQNHQVKRFEQFELGRVFEPRADQQLPRERYVLAIMLCGPRQQWYAESDRLDFYDGKGVVSAIFSQICGEPPTTELDERLDAAAPFLHPRRRASICLAGKSVGCLGELHPEVVEALKLEGQPVFASIDVETALEVIEARGDRQVKPLPRFPAVTRDIAVIVSEELTAGEVAEWLKQAAGGLAEEVTLFDIYRGTPVASGRKSMAFHVVYREPSTTLTDSRVDEAHERVVRAVEKRFGGIVRTGS